MNARHVGRKLTVGISIALVLLVAGTTVGTGLLFGPLAVSPHPSIGTTGSLPKSAAPAAPFAASSAAVQGAALRAATERILPADQFAFFASLSPTVWQKAAHVVQANAGLRPFLTTATILSTGVGVGVGCAIAGAVSLGVACIAILAALAVVAIMEVLFGDNAAALLNGAANNWVASIMLSLKAGLAVEANAVHNELNALNLTGNALGYEAAAAALLQLGNGSFNVALDLVQSTVASQLETVLLADEMALSGLDTYITNLFSTTFAAGTVYGSQGICRSYTMSAGTINNNLVQNVGSLCSTSGPNGTLFPSDIYPLATANSATDKVFIPHGAGVSLGWTGTFPPSAWSVRFTPVEGGRLPTFINGTGPTSVGTTNVTFAGLTGGYIINATVVQTNLNVFITTSFPLDSATAAHLGSGSLLYIGTGTTDAGKADYASVPITATATGGSTVTLGGSNSQTSMVAYLNTLEQNAAVVGQTYWTFLRGLGYTSIAQVPPQCIIPLPSTVLPANMPPSTLAGLNVTQLLDLYYSYLYQLGYTFNATSGLTVSNFCGKHLTFNFSNVVLQFGTYGIGFVYLPTATKNSTGLGPQKFGVPSSWNQSGQVLVSPAFRDMSIPVNQTWLLPQKEPSFVLVHNTTPSHIYARGNVTPNTFLFEFATGNSSNLNGSVFPTQVETTVASGNVSIYLTQCWLAANATAFALGLPTTWTHPTTCVFHVGTINFTSPTFPCGSVLGTPCSVPTGPAGLTLGASCGQTLVVWSTFVAAWASVTGTSPLGCIVAEALAAISLIIVVAIILYVAVAVFERRR